MIKIVNGPQGVCCLLTRLEATHRLPSGTQVVRCRQLMGPKISKQLNFGLIEYIILDNLQS